MANSNEKAYDSKTYTRISLPCNKCATDQPAGTTAPAPEASVTDDTETSIPAAGNIRVRRGAGTEGSRNLIFLDREISQIAFNWRVLAQAEDKQVPLLERLKYLCIVGSNLDEFFEVRIASLLAQNTVDGELSQDPAFRQQLRKISENCHQLAQRQYEC
jgi:hypothetical protein